MNQSPWEFFTLEELKCRCGCPSTGLEMINIFMEKMVALRRLLNFEFPVNSAYRCPAYNAKISKTKSLHGPHTTGKAMDIGVSGEKADLLLEASYKKGITGKGVNQKGASNFIHIDILTKEEGFKRPLVWSY